MIRFAAFLITSILIGTSAYSQDALSTKAVDAGAYSTSATFSIDGKQKPMTSVVATIEDHPMYGPQYKWLTLHFYAFPLTQENIASAKTGDIEPIKKRIYKGDYNNSNAKVILLIDSKSNQITQVDMAVPGYTCTVVAASKELQKFSENYVFANSRLKLKNDGSHECGVITKQTPFKFGWNFNLDTPVTQKQPDKSH